jgi:hypothetical protein
MEVDMRSLRCIGRLLYLTAVLSIAGLSIAWGQPLVHQLFLAWKGLDGDPNIYYTLSDGRNNWPPSWAPQSVIAGVGTSLRGPSVTVYNGLGLFLAWKGMGDDPNIYYTFGDGTNWARQQAIAGVGTSFGPSVVDFGHIPFQ